MSTTQVARFKSDTTFYSPHNLGVTYSNANLTNKAARDILAADPDATDLFDVLPPAADDAAPGAGADPADSQATSAAGTGAPAATVPAGFDYAKLASALADELERRQQSHEVVPATLDSTAPVLTASAGGTSQPDTPTSAPDANTADPAADSAKPSGADGEGDADSTSTHGDDQGERPVRLSRQNKDQLRATYAAELGHAPSEELTADELRGAIAQHREAQGNAE